MTRTYERDTKHYDFAVLTHLVETGQATFFEGPGIFVIKTEDGTVAVRPHQVIFTATPAPFDIVVPDEAPVAEAPADDAEDVATVAAWAALDRIHAVAVAEGEPKAAAPRNGWYSASETDELLQHFIR